VIAELNRLPWPWIDRETLQVLLKVGRRRAQQILQPCVTRQIGSSGVAAREDLMAHLQRLASGENAHYERRRRQRLAQAMDDLRRAALAEPKLLLEAPTSIVSQQLANLPVGVTISPGNISIAFSSPAEALERLLALAMAIGNDFTEFERTAGG
jgi:hypothetical protein